MIFEKTIAEKPSIHNQMEEHLSCVFGELDALLAASEAVNEYSTLNHPELSDDEISAAQSKLHETVPESVLFSIGGVEQAVDAFTVKAQGALGKLIGEKWEKFVTWYSGKDYDGQAKALIEKLKSSDEIGGRVVSHYNASPVTQNKGKELVPASTLAARLNAMSSVDRHLEAMLGEAVKSKGKSFKDIFPSVAKKAFGYIGKDSDGYPYVSFDNKSDLVMSAIDTLETVPLDWNIEYWYHRTMPRATHSTADAIKVLNNIGGIEGSLKRLGKTLKNKWAESSLDLNKEELTRVRQVLSFAQDYLMFCHAFTKGVITLYKESLKAPKSQKSKENASFDWLAVYNDNFIHLEEIELDAAKHELETLLAAERALDTHSEVVNGGWVRPDVEAIADNRLYAEVSRTLIDDMGGVSAAKRGMGERIKEAVKRVMTRLWEYIKKLIGIDYKTKIDNLQREITEGKYTVRKDKTTMSSGKTIGIKRSNFAMNFRDFQMNVRTASRARYVTILPNQLAGKDTLMKEASILCIDAIKEIFPTFGKAQGKIISGTHRQGGNWWIEGTQENPAKRINWRTVSNGRAVGIEPTGADIRTALELCRDLAFLWNVLISIEEKVGKSVKEADANMDGEVVATFVGLIGEITKYQRQVAVDGYRYLQAILVVDKQPNLDNAPN